MVMAQRWEAIIALVSERDYVSVEELVHILSVSQATIRRDLQAMEDEKLILRYHGGAQALKSNIVEGSMQLKSYQNRDLKDRIAARGAACIEDGQIIFLDAGTTTYHLIDYIKARNITVVTSGVPHVAKLVKRNIKTFLLGGFVKPNTEAVTGKDTIAMIRKMTFDVALVGTNGIHKTAGFTTPDEFEAEVKSIAIQNAKKAYIVADHSKFHVLCFVPFAKLHEATVITDQEVNFDGEGIDVIVA